MEKSIKCLKEEVSKLRGYAVIIDGEDGEWEPVTTVSVEDIYELINQLDKLEVLSQEFINEKAVEVYADTADAEVHVSFRMRDLQNLLVPKQELPVIPKFVAETIEKDKEHGYDVYDSIDLIIETNGGGLPSISNWVTKNIDKYARAWLDGFTVETEQRYYVINNDQRMMLVRMMDGKTITEADPFKLEDMYEAEKKAHRLTEKEIKDYDPRYWAFRKPVEEVKIWK